MSLRAAAELDRSVELNNGVRIPTLGFGTWRLNGAGGRRAIEAALRAGYRLLDTASYYDNEAEVGEAMAASGVPREEIFVTTKLWSQEHGYKEAKAALDRSLGRLGLEQVDLYLIHWPTDGRRDLETWRALVEMMEAGRARAIGVSNFSMAEIEPLVEATGVVPAVDQVEMSPYELDRPLLESARAAGIRIMAYSPLKGMDLRDPSLGLIARAHGKSSAQTVIRWVMQKGAIPLVKSAHPDRIRENIDVFDFRLTRKEMETLDNLR